jgi:hypothetical protein
MRNAFLMASSVLAIGLVVPSLLSAQAPQATPPDPCTLVTLAEASQLLGVIAIRTPVSGGAACIYAAKGGGATLWITITNNRARPNQFQLRGDLQGHSRGVPVNPVSGVGDAAMGFHDAASFGISFSKGTLEVVVWAHGKPGSVLDFGQLTNVCRSAAGRL